MRMFNDIMPPFSAAVIVELHENDLGNYFVQVTTYIIYNNECNDIG